MNSIFACYMYICIYTRVYIYDMYVCMYVVVALDKNDNSKNDNNIVRTSIRRTQKPRHFSLILLDQEDDLIVTIFDPVCSSDLSLSLSLSD